MAGSIYVALSGMRTRMAQFDRVATDLANESTVGYKGERVASMAVNRPVFDAVLEAAVDSTPTPSKIDFSPGEITPTGRELDLALDGKGFFEIETPVGKRYTRNGHFTRTADGVMTALDGSPVMGDEGPISLPEGKIDVRSDGTVWVGKVAAGKLKVVDFKAYDLIGRSAGGRFSVPDSVERTEGLAAIRGGALEQSNVSTTERLAHLTEVARGFEALQRGISVMANDIDGRAISELGRR